MLALVKTRTVSYYMPGLSDEDPPEFVPEDTWVLLPHRICPCCQGRGTTWTNVIEDDECPDICTNCGMLARKDPTSIVPAHSWWLQVLSQLRTEPKRSRRGKRRRWGTRGDLGTAA